LGKTSKEKDEIWKDIPGYEDLYQASDFGNIRSLPRTTTKGVILCIHINKRNGYSTVSLSKNNMKKTVRVHKLVYSAFFGDMITNGYDKNKQINHIDGRKQNNALSNLEVRTQSENQIHAFANGLQKKIGRKVICLDNQKVFNTLTDAAKNIGSNNGESVARVCRGERSHYKGYRFSFYEDYLNNAIPDFKGKYRRRVMICR